MGLFRKGTGTSIVPAASREVAQQGRSWWEGKKEVAGLSRATESIAAKRELTKELRGLWGDLTDLNQAIEDHGASEARLRDAPVRYEAEKRERHIGYLKTDMEYMDTRMKHAAKQVEYEKTVQGAEEEIRRFRPSSLYGQQATAGGAKAEQSDQGMNGNAHEEYLHEADYAGSKNR